MSAASAPAPAERRVPSGLATAWTMAAVTLRRLARGRGLWVTGVIAALPVLYAAAMPGVGQTSTSHELFAFEVLALTVLAPMLIGASIGEEIEDRTTTYLWSRPVPRWAILAGKLLALAPVVMVASTASWLLAHAAGGLPAPPASATAALGLGALIVSLATMGISALGPRHGTALAICYLLFFDLPLSMLPATVQRISIAFQIRAIAGEGTPGATATGGVVALLVLGAAWTVVAALRIRRMEA